MPIFKPNKSNPPDPPPQDPPAGDPPPEDPPSAEYVKKEDFDKLQDTLNTLNIKIESFANQPAVHQPAQQFQQPPKPDPTEKRLETIEAELAKVSPEEIDKAAYEGKGVGAMLNRREQLLAEKSRIETEKMINTRVAQVENVGLSAIDKLSREVTAGKMPMLKIAAVKKDYDDYMSALDPSLRINPETQMMAYQTAVGANIDAVFEAKFEERIRSENPPDAAPPGGTSGRSASDSENEVPPPEKVWDTANLQALRNKGTTPEAYVKSLGYKDWAEYYTQNKAYFVGEESA